MASGQQDFKFELSLSVLNHLGRNLYRNFVTVLGEAISNSWDADAKNVWIHIDRDNDAFSIKDDGVGMNADDFQGKFLKIGYSKRKDGKTRTIRDRPYIGAKGIGKLALLSCAERISVYTKKQGFDYVGGTIDNGQLDQAITDDLTPQQYELERVDADSIKGLSEGHSQGTIICFQDMKGSIRNSEKFIRKTLAMSFKFSLIDNDFNIHVNGRRVGIDDLKDLARGTQFLWLINDYEDPYLSTLDALRADPVGVTSKLPIKGFLATVVKPRDAKIDGTDERASVDLFVNGRLREKNILRHIPTQRILESYLYGQIHYDSMDRGTKDPFTSSREGVLESDKEFRKLLDYLQEDLVPQLLKEWDELRRAINEEGDDEDDRVSKRDRKAKAFISEAEREFSPDKGEPNKSKVDDWLSDIRKDAEYNVSAYVDCFLTENLLRKYIGDQLIALNARATNEASDYKEKEGRNLVRANIYYSITRSQDDLCYLGMDTLSVLSEDRERDGANINSMPLCRDNVMYKPIRNAVGHMSLLTGEAKDQLRMTLISIKGRVKFLLRKVRGS